MNFLEKNLEDIIWNNYEACAERGLDLNDYGVLEDLDRLRLRQPALHPYGIADLVNFYYDPYIHRLAIQVIECKKAVVNLDTYKQAKRYETAYRHFLEKPIAHVIKNGGSVVYETVLVGASFDPTNDFGFIYNSDATCSAYVYSYNVDGIRFERVDKTWQRTAANPGCMQAAQKQVSDFARASIFNNIREMEEHAAYNKLWIQKEGDHYEPLLITPNGVLLNPRIVNNHFTTPFADGEQ
jgi:hypothetical protein